MLDAHCNYTEKLNKNTKNTLLDQRKAKLPPKDDCHNVVKRSRYATGITVLPANTEESSNAACNP